MVVVHPLVATVVEYFEEHASSADRSACLLKS